VCSMTGDGVNDCLALKKADIGVAMGITGSDAAQGAAKMILLDDSFSSIVLAIEEGRRIYSNISKFVYFLLSTNIAEVFLILIASIIGLQSPLVPVQILWLNLMTDSLPALALANEPIEPKIMTQAPRPKRKAIIDKLMITSIAIHTVILTAVTLGTYIWGLDHYTGTWTGIRDTANDDESEELAMQVRQAQTLVIFVIVFAELLRGYTSRSLTESLWSVGLWTNSWMQYSVFSSIGLTFLVGVIPGVQTVFGMEPLDGIGWLWVFGFSLLPGILDEILKWVYRVTGFEDVEENLALAQAAQARGSVLDGHAALMEVKTADPDAIVEV